LSEKGRKRTSDIKSEKGLPPSPTPAYRGRLELLFHEGGPFNWIKELWDS